jgi:8-amino-7-oxononanoate synthase
VSEALLRRLAEQTDALREQGLYKEERVIHGPQRAVIEVGGREVINLCANNYLGLAGHPDVVRAAHAALDAHGYGMASVRFICGTQDVHRELEDRLSSFLGTEDTILYSSCFDANGGLFETILDAEDAVISDELNHASIIDGCRLARAAVQVYRHGDLEHLATLLEGTHGPAIVVSDTVFSMDGDAADLAGLLEVTGRHGALLVLDEAHAVYGPDLPVGPLHDSQVPVLRVGTLSKTLGSLGGFVAGSRDFVDLLVNAARPFIFTTATPPADAAAALAALDVITSPEGDVLVGKLRHHVARLADRLGEPLASPIVPVVLGAEETALAAAAGLGERGLLVPAIRPPTVAEGTSRLRVALSAAQEHDQVTALLAGLDAVAPGWAPPSTTAHGAPESRSSASSGGPALGANGDGALAATATRARR